MNNNTQSRKWIMTFNNPMDYGLTPEIIVETMMKFCPTYLCMSSEIAITGTPHMHGFFYAAPARFQTVKGRFPTAHIEKAYGSVQDNRDYIAKSGKWAESNKADTVVAGSFIEWGKIPSEPEEKNPQMAKLIDSIKDGTPIMQIVENNPNLAFHIRDIEALKQTIMCERHKTEMRNLDVTYAYGISGSGKTHGIYERYRASDICRITHYNGNRGVNFDAYNGQDVLVFEEFNSQIPIEEMLNYLDQYPIMLPARYNDRIGCYTKVFITSNTALSDQYKYVQVNRPETWKAFLRRINNVYRYSDDGRVTVEKGA